jgi:hypothetical protein
MTSIILVTNGARPRLLEQTLRTLRDNTPVEEFNLVVVGDGFGPFQIPHAPLYFFPAGPIGIIGALKNKGVEVSEKQFGRGEWLLFIDDDVAFLSSDWLPLMQASFEYRNQLRLLGGVRHPYHGVNDASLGILPFVEYTDAVAGYCHLMRWSTWDRFGPYDAHAKGTGQSEDFAICRKIVDAGGKIGYIYPPVMAHCGLTDSSGKPILGAELIERVEGVLYE